MDHTIEELNVVDKKVYHVVFMLQDLNFTKKVRIKDEDML